MVFQPRDLSIHIQATGSRNLVLNGGPEGATFPGWFLTIQQNEGYDAVVMPVQLTPAQVEEIAAKIDEVVIDPTVDYASSRVRNAVKRCDSAMKNEIKRQLEAAEASAARIPELKKRLEEME